MNCVLCHQCSSVFFTDERTHAPYYHCVSCDLRFIDPSFRLGAEEEKSRYLNHQNDVNDEGYQNFVRPLAALIREKFDQDSVGLDYGCGEGPVLAHILAECGYKIELYDPFFRRDPEVLEKKYDFIVSVEVIEHFFLPGVEFAKLKSLLKPGGHLGLMTHIYDESIEFLNWYYRRDPTHVCFYSARTFEWIRRELGFETFTQQGERIAWLQ